MCFFIYLFYWNHSNNMLCCILPVTKKCRPLFPIIIATTTIFFSLFFSLFIGITMTQDEKCLILFFVWEGFYIFFQYLLWFFKRKLFRWILFTTLSHAISFLCEICCVGQMESVILLVSVESWMSNLLRNETTTENPKFWSCKGICAS